MKPTKPSSATGKELVLVTWEDIVSNAAWVEEQDEPEPVTIMSVGWMVRCGVKKGGRYILIASCLPLDQEDKVKGSLTAIPFGVVTSVEVIG